MNQAPTPSKRVKSYPACYPKAARKRGKRYPVLPTHEQYIQAIATIATARLDAEDQAKLHAKIVYGVGERNVRGVTRYGAWRNGQPNAVALVELCACNEESPAQVAGTLLHELAHVLAGHGAGHDKEWKLACAKLGLRKAKAAGTQYMWARFNPEIREKIVIAAFADGKPELLGGASAGVNRTGAGGCTAGLGTQGGKSRGPGSGRMRKFTCECAPPVIVRAARDELPAHCDLCKAAFKRAEDKPQPTTGD